MDDAFVCLCLMYSGLDGRDWHRKDIRQRMRFVLET